MSEQILDAQEVARQAVNVLGRNLTNPTIRAAWFCLMLEALESALPPDDQEATLQQIRTNIDDRLRFGGWA
jgi:hypothetical protein